MPRRDRPVASTIVLCDNLLKDPTSGKVTLEGVFTRINAGGFPYTHPSFWAYLQLYDFTTAGLGTLLVTVNRKTGEFVADAFQHISPPSAGPYNIKTVYYRIDNCPFPQAGVYWVEFYWNENKVAGCPLRLV